MRYDGAVTVYVLQARDPSKKNEWFGPSFDRYGYPPGYTSSGDCWQQTGIHATFLREEGDAALAWMAKKHPALDWQLLERSMTQYHRPLAVVFAKGGQSFVVARN